MKLIQKLLIVPATLLVLVGCSGFSENDSENELLAASKKQDSNTPIINRAERISELEDKIFELVNQYRINHDLMPLELNEEVSKIAREHSENMANGIASWSHHGYGERAGMVSSIIDWEELGENLARNNFSFPAIKALEEWAESHLHEENMVGAFNTSGVGVAISPDGEFFFTQLFVRN